MSLLRSLHVHLHFPLNLIFASYFDSLMISGYAIAMFCNLEWCFRCLDNFLLFSLNSLVEVF